MFRCSPSRFSNLKNVSKTGVQDYVRESGRGDRGRMRHGGMGVALGWHEKAEKAPVGEVGRLRRRGGGLSARKQRIADVVGTAYPSL